jgi:hypothetical protein
MRRRAADLAAALAALQEAVPRDRRDPAYRNAVASAERALADLEALSRELPGLVSSMRQAARESAPRPVPDEPDTVDDATTGEYSADARRAGPDVSSSGPTDTAPDGSGHADRHAAHTPGIEPDAC